MTKTAIAAEVHQTLDVDTDFTTKVALDQIVAVDHFADLQYFLVAELADATIGGDLHLLDDLGSVLLADTMDVLERDQNALVGRDIHAGNTGHGLLSCRRSLADRTMFCVNSGRYPQTRTRRPSPHSSRGPASSNNYPTWMRGLLKDSRRFRQPPLAFSSLFRDLFCGPADGLFGGLFCCFFSLLRTLALGCRGRLFGALGSRLAGLWGRFSALLGGFGWLFAGRLGGLAGRPGGPFGGRGRAGRPGVRRADRSQNPVNLPRDVLDGHHAIHSQQLAALGIIVNQRLGQRPVARQALGEHFGGVIDSHFLAAGAHLGDAGLDTAEQRALVDAQFDHGVELDVLLLQELVERRRLR